MMLQLFNILEKVDSSNNYAMQQVHEGMAKHGMAWFALQQFSGKGQRGKTWVSLKGENVILSVAIQPPGLFEVSRFYFNALISITVRNFVQELLHEPVFIKWPNDIYIGDKKAGGILIENIINSTSWKWAIIGIGLNINQEKFEQDLSKAISLFQITNIKLDILTVAKKLHIKILEEVERFSLGDELMILTEYNNHLYRMNEVASLKDRTGVFNALIKGVDENGNLIVQSDTNKLYRFGEIEWII